MESEHSRGVLLAFCHRRAMTGLVQKLGKYWGPLWPEIIESVARAKRVVIEESLQDEKQRVNRLVATAVGSRGSRLSAIDIARRSIFMDGAEGLSLSRHTSKGFRPALSRVAKFSITKGRVEE